MKKNFHKSLLLAIAILSYASLILILHGCNSDSKHRKNKGHTAIYNFTLSDKGPQPGPGIRNTDVKENCIALLKKRIEAAGYSYSLDPGADGTWTLTANDISDTAGFWQMLTATGYMEFRETYHIDEISTPLLQAFEKSKKILDSIAKSKGWDSVAGGLASILRLSYSRGEPGPQRAEIGWVLNKDTSLLYQILQHKDIASCFPIGLEFLMGNRNPHENFQSVYATKTTLLPLTNRYISFAQAQMDQLSNQWTVVFRFNDEGARIWYNITERAALQGHKAIAMCLDKKVIYAPLVDEAITGGNCRIVLGNEPGHESIGEAKLLAAILADGILPMEVVLNSKKFK